MKKRIFIGLIGLMCLLSCYAQEWRVYHQPADELLGTEETTWFRYAVDGDGSFTILDANRLQFMLESEYGIFNYRRHEDGRHQGAEVLVGLYDCDELMYKFTMWLDLVPNSAGKALRTRNGGALTNPDGQDKNVKQIITHLMKTTGNVRFVVERYDKPLFDLFVMSMKSE